MSHDTTVTRSPHTSHLRFSKLRTQDKYVHEIIVLMENKYFYKSIEVLIKCSTPLCDCKTMSYFHYLVDMFICTLYLLYLTVGSIH